MISIIKKKKKKNCLSYIKLVINLCNKVIHNANDAIK